jgi:hypothetical protein
MIKFFTEIHLGGMVVRDPVTALTNVFIFLAGWWCWKQVKNSPATHVKSWSWFFLLVGLASLIGVAVHGFSFYIPERIHFWTWIVMGLVQNLGVSFAQVATAQLYFSKQSRWITILVAGQYLAFAAILISFESYEAVKWHVALGMLPIMGWCMYRWAKGDRAAQWIATGILISGLTAAVHGFKVSISLEWFNYNDIAHLLVVASLLVMVRGVKEEKVG